MFIKLASLMLSLLCFCCNGYSQAIIGRDHLGLLSPHFPYVEAARQLNPVSAVGILDFTFSSQTAPFEYLLSNSKPKYARVHILNNTCVRNKNCGKYEPLYSYTLSSLEAAILRKDPKILNHLKSRVTLYKDIQTRNPDTQILISPILEHNLKFPAWRILADTVKQVWPTVQLVNSPMRGVSAESYKGSWVEGHGTPAEKNKKTYSHDGSEASDINIDAWVRDTKGAVISFTWTRSDNLRTQNSIWVDPRARKAAPTKRLLEEMIHITDVVSKVSPSFTCSFKAFDNTFIWKPLSEDKGNGDTRANYPVLIAKPRVSAAKLVDIKGKDVAALGYYGKYTDGRNRYYSKFRGGNGLGGYEIEKKANAQSGSRFTYFKVGNTCYGPILTGRRQGAFR